MPANVDVDHVLCKIRKQMSNIEIAAQKISGRLKLYQLTQRERFRCDLRDCASYQGAFRNFYQMQKMPKSCQLVVFDILEREKFNQDIQFRPVLREIFERSGRVEASFASKIVATIRPNAAVYDSKVRALLELGKFPYWAPKCIRLEKAEVLYSCISDFAISAIEHDKFPALEADFNRIFPECSIFDPVKKLDILMWKTRAQN